MFGIDGAAKAIEAITNIGGKVIERMWPDPAAADQAKREWAKLASDGLAMQLAHEAGIFQARADIVKTEAASTHWLASNWRPLTMLTFVCLIVARWFGFAAPNLAPEEYLALWDIVELGLGGYVIGRSVEKIAPNVAEMLKK